QYPLFKPDMRIQFFLEPVQRSFGIFRIMKKAIYPPVFLKGTLDQFIFRFHNGKQIFFLIMEMWPNFMFIKPVGIFHHPLRCHVLTKSLANLPTEQQAKMMLTTQRLESLMAFYWFLGFHIYY